MAAERMENAGEVVSPEQAERAEKIKEQANDYFREKTYEKAIELYTEAISHNPNVPAYYGNRSICYLRTECFGYAVSDADTALSLDKTYIKGYYRRAVANMALQKFKSSLKDLETVVKYRPKDADAKLKYDECKKTCQRLAFERAIAVDVDSKPLSETLDLDKMVVEDDYDGPRIGSEGMTEEFVLAVMERFKQQKTLHNKYAYQILLEVKKHLMSLPSLVDITIPEDRHFTVCGDVHGQFYDLMNIFDLNGLPSKENPYLFNGDFVDRGSFSCEVIFTLFSLKLLYPNHFFLSRGNHESTAMNQMYGFEGEVKQKYTAQMVDLFTEVYNWLPLAHCINKKVLVMHGGLFSEDNVLLDDIKKTERNRQPPEKGIMCDVLWSDPQPQSGRSPSKRGVGCQFGPDITKQFCEQNNLDYIIRSHEVKADGYEVAHEGRCITVFSAPNYCDQMGNKGAFITMSSNLQPKFTSYEAVPHPNVKPMAYANSLMSLFSGFM